IVDVILVKNRDYIMFDDLYSIFKDDLSYKEIGDGEVGIKFNGITINVPEKNKETMTLREFAEMTGISTGGLWYDFITQLNDPESVMPTNYVLDCFDLLELANYLQPYPKMLSRFWKWFLGGVEAYLDSCKNWKEGVTNMMGSDEKEREIMVIRALKNKKGVVTAIEALYRF